MIIQWHGGACVTLQAQDSENSLVFSPFDSSLGIKIPRMEGDIIACSKNLKAYSSVDEVASPKEHPPFIVRYPGEYEVKGVFLFGIPVQDNQTQETKDSAVTLFTTQLDGIYVAYLGALNRPLKTAEIDALGKVDILLVPVGGHSVLSARAACEVISQLEPRIVIPIEYDIPGLKTEADGIEAFTKEYGVKEPEILDKLKIAKKDLPVEDTKVILLNAR